MKQCPVCGFPMQMFGGVWYCPGCGHTEEADNLSRAGREHPWVTIVFFFVVFVLPVLLALVGVWR